MKIDVKIILGKHSTYGYTLEKKNYIISIDKKSLHYAQGREAD